jgi:hypothetical protein
LENAATFMPQNEDFFQSCAADERVGSGGILEQAPAFAIPGEVFAAHDWT